jgi:hypothetical protein
MLTDKITIMKTSNNMSNKDIYYICQSCRYLKLADNYNYCPKCGVKIEWKTDEKYK